jgi:hypothetical protein
MYFWMRGKRICYRAAADADATNRHGLLKYLLYLLYMLLTNALIVIIIVIYNTLNRNPIKTELSRSIPQPNPNAVPAILRIGTGGSYHLTPHWPKHPLPFESFTISIRPSPTYLMQTTTSTSGSYLDS